MADGAERRKKKRRRATSQPEAATARKGAKRRERRGAGAGIGKRVANEDSDAKKKPARVWQEQLS
jgi:hypothetical protein